MAPLYGLVLAGGLSSRMGRDKAWIEYHGSPHALWLAGLINPLCAETLISYNSPYPENFDIPFERLPDAMIFRDIGPMGGVLSAFLRNPDAAWLIVGCDYPNVNKEMLQTLIDARRPEISAVAFRNPESQLVEPLIAVYEPSCLSGLMNAFHAGEFSLRHFLGSIPVSLSEHADPSQLKSIDLAEDAQRLGGVSRL